MYVRACACACVCVCACVRVGCPLQELADAQARLERLKAAAPKAVRQSKVKASTQKLAKLRQALGKLQRDLDEAELQLQAKHAEMAQLVEAAE